MSHEPMSPAATRALLLPIGQPVRVAHGGDPLAQNFPVDSARDLVAVITRLRSDLTEHADEWENSTLERFLDAMAAWLSAFPQSYINTGESTPDPDWRFVADLLRAARVYE